MKFRALLSLTIGLTVMQMASLASASPSTQVYAQAVGSVQGSGGTADMTLNKARWSLPSCGVMKPTEAPHKAVEEEEDFPTPASVEAEEKGHKKVAKGKAPATTSVDPAAAGTPGTATGAAASSEVADTDQAQQVVTPSAPFVRLTLTPQAEQQTQAKTPAIAKSPVAVKAPTFARAPIAQKTSAAVKTPSVPVETAVAKAPKIQPAAAQTAISTRTVGSPIPGPSNYVPATTNTAVKMAPASSVSSTPQSTSAPMPGAGAPLPGSTPVGSPAGTTVRPSKTAAKGNTQANAGNSPISPEA